ncbi:hypothetical protein [Cupriavidus numazuensis]|uniref:Uncharacterized protein n=1 Tax=Cupriavidus numazuensis TaxID=221992 RepID=A0ABM8TDN4_9BURK|nr:hypothetical protein [Cupriavidus numazuensis]CAG2137999.1 hypothetical protein LMG26411_01505 [Cupriavidus numazuensis]
MKLGMLSLVRMIEEFGLRMQERRLARLIRRQRLHALPQVFGESLAALQAVFADTPVDLRGANSPNGYPAKEHLGELGLNAILLTQNIEINQFPQYLKMLGGGRDQVANHHYESDGLHTFIAYDDECGGRNVRLLSNDVELLAKVSTSTFHPPPPWIAWYELGPYRPALQGNAEHWFCHVWDPFWESLSLEAQDKFIEASRLRTQAHISNEDWEEGWVYLVRMRDPRYRANPS